MKKIFTLLLILTMIIVYTTMLSSCQNLTDTDTDGGKDDIIDNSGDNLPEKPNIDLDPDAIKAPFAKEFFDSVFDVEWQTMQRDTERNSELAQLMQNSYFIGYDYHQYQNYRKHSYYTENADGTILSELHGKSTTISFYTGNGDFSRQYNHIEDIDVGYEISYNDEEMGRGYIEEMYYGIKDEHPFISDGVKNYPPLDFSDNFQYTLFREEVTSYGYAEKNGCYYFHIEVTMPLPDLDGRITHVDRYYRLDENYNITAYYSKLENRYKISFDNDEYSHDIVENICLPYNSYFDMPAEAYSI